MIFGFILNCVNSHHGLSFFFSPPDLRSLLDSSAAAVCRRCSPHQRQPCHNYQPPFPSLAALGWTATASDLSSSGPCCPCSSVWRRWRRWQVLLLLREEHYFETDVYFDSQCLSIFPAGSLNLELDLQHIDFFEELTGDWKWEENNS